MSNARTKIEAGKTYRMTATPASWQASSKPQVWEVTTDATNLTPRWLNGQINGFRLNGYTVEVEVV